MRLIEWLRLWVIGTPIAKKVKFSEDFGDIASGSVIDIEVPNDLLLVRDVTLPRLSGAALHRAVELDAQRATPFQKDTISVGQTVLARSKNKVSVRQYVARHSDVDRWVSVARKAGLNVRKIAPEGAPEAVLADFTSALMARSAFWRKANVSLVVVIVLLAGFGMWRTTANLEKERALAEARATELRQEAARLLDQINGVEARSSGLRLVEQRQNDSIQFLQRVDGLTRALPDSAWVVHVNLERDKTQVTGNTLDEPLAVLDLVAAVPGNGAPILHKSFPLNDGTGGQRFEIEIPVEEHTE